MAKRTEWDYIVDVKMPAALKNVEPGKLHASLLRDISGGGKLFYLAADAWNAMVEAAKADGVELKPTSSGDLYRSYDSQKAGFLTRYSLQDTGTGSTKTFEGKTWYLKKGMAMLATPGKSMHNLGIAVDIANCRRHAGGACRRQLTLQLTLPKKTTSNFCMHRCPSPLAVVISLAIFADHPACPKAMMQQIGGRPASSAATMVAHLVVVFLGINSVRAGDIRKHLDLFFTHTSVQKSPPRTGH